MFSNELWQKSGVSTYSIDQSIRFNPADSAYMEKTFSGAGNKKQFTISLWLKRSLLGSRQDIWSFNQDVPLTFMDDDTLRPFLFGSITLQTNRRFRDPSAWYHIVLTVDSTNQISTDRIRMYVNGQRETSFSAEVYPSLNADASIWTAGTDLRLFRLIGGTNYYGGYAAEIHYLDGYSYGPEYFGETNSNGIWVPKEYDGSYGTNGFKIDGRDSSDLGDDESGQGNDFTTSGLAAHDQMPDTPTNNQITFNPLNNQQSGGTPKNGNLEYSGPGTRTMISLTAAIPSSGKWAVAFKTDTVSTDAGFNFGINLMTNTNYGDAAGSNEDFGNPLGLHGYPSTSDLYLNYYDGGGNNVNPSPLIDLATDDELWCAIDMDTGKAWIGLYNKSGSSFIWIAEDGGNDGNPATGANPSHTFSEFIGNSDVTFGVAGKQTSITLTLLRESDCEGTTPTGFTYFENVKDLI